MSFRTRLFVLALLLVGVVVSAVLYAGWASLLSHESDRLNVRLCIEARRLAQEPRHASEPRRLENDLISKLHLENPTQLSFVVGQAGSTSKEFRGGTPPPDINAIRWQACEPADGALAGCAVGATGADGEWRWGRMMAGANIAVVGADLAATLGGLRRELMGTLATIIPISLALAALVAWLIAAAAIRPVTRLQDAMVKTRTASLDRRLDDAGEDAEFGELIATYNDMLARLQASFEQASRFSADAAHELMTPLAILRGRIEESRRREENESAQAEWDDLLDEVGRLIAIVRKLLLLSRADAGQLPLERKEVDLSALLHELAADAEMAAVAPMTVQVAEGLRVSADPTLLRQLLNNLMSNALRYCTRPGWIRITGASAGHAVSVCFANASTALSSAERAHLFDRFYRGDASRTRGTGGSGLGLSIATEIALAHGGSLVLDPGPDDEVSLTLTLPKA